MSATPAAATDPSQLSAADCQKIRSAPRYTWDDKLDASANFSACYALKTAGIENPYRHGCKPRDADAICNEELASQMQAARAAKQKADADTAAAAHAEKEALALEARQMPKPGMRDKGIEQQLTKLLKKDLASGDTLLKVLIADDGWRIERHERSGVITMRWMYYQHAFKRGSDGKCFLSDKDWFYQEHLGAKFGQTELHGGGELAEIKCDRVK